jgi:hypothetical protein
VKAGDQLPGLEPWEWGSMEPQLQWTMAMAG